MEFVITILLIIALGWFLVWLVDHLGAPPPVRWIIIGVLAIVVLFIILKLAGIGDLPVRSLD